MTERARKETLPYRDFQKLCHCEERSDVAISCFYLRFCRIFAGTGSVKTLPYIKMAKTRKIYEFLLIFIYG